MKRSFFETGRKTRGTTQIAQSRHSGSYKPYTDNAVSACYPTSRIADSEAIGHLLTSAAFHHLRLSVRCRAENPLFVAVFRIILSQRTRLVKMFQKLSKS